MARPRFTRLTLAVLLLATALGGCSDESPDEKDDTTPPVPPPPPPPPPPDNGSGQNDTFELIPTWEPGHHGLTPLTTTGPSSGNFVVAYGFDGYDHQDYRIGVYDRTTRSWSHTYLASIANSTHGSSHASWAGNTLYFLAEMMERTSTGGLPEVIGWIVLARWEDGDWTVETDPERWMNREAHGMAASGEGLAVVTDSFQQVEVWERWDGVWTSTPLPDVDLLSEPHLAPTPNGWVVVATDKSGSVALYEGRHGQFQKTVITLPRGSPGGEFFEVGGNGQEPAWVAWYTGLFVETQESQRTYVTSTGNPEVQLVDSTNRGPRSLLGHDGTGWMVTGNTNGGSDHRLWHYTDSWQECVIPGLTGKADDDPSGFGDWRLQLLDGLPYLLASPYGEPRGLALFPLQGKCD